MRLTHKYKYKAYIADNKRFALDMKDYRKVCQKLGQLEDLLEKYGIEDLIDLNVILAEYFANVKEHSSKGK